MKQVKLIVIGAGDRGTTHGGYALQYPQEAKVVGVAEPREYYRNRLAGQHQIPPENAVADWVPLAERPRFADAVIITTPDIYHVKPALAFIKKGYHLMLEKPMAVTEKDCRDIALAALSNKTIMAVGHVLRYTTYTQKIKSMIDSGLIGEVVDIQHLEPIGYWHFAHSYVRGNWRNEAGSSFMLMAKSCHDIDWIQYIMGARCLKISSFGALKYFIKQNKPSGAGTAKRCLDCRYETKCPYSAKHIYFSFLERGITGWPVDVVTPDTTKEGVLKALKDGPYGRCVYECDNDVVDHQVVNMFFEGGQTASFTVNGFNKGGGRKTRIFGTRGELYGDGVTIEHFDFLTDQTEVIEIKNLDQTILGGHGGGDERLMRSFVAAVAGNDQSKILSGPEETLKSHLMIFAAEKSRREGRVVEL